MVSNPDTLQSVKSLGVFEGIQADKGTLKERFLNARYPIMFSRPPAAYGDECERLQEILMNGLEKKDRLGEEEAEQLILIVHALYRASLKYENEPPEERRDDAPQDGGFF